MHGLKKERVRGGREGGKRGREREEERWGERGGEEGERKERRGKRARSIEWRKRIKIQYGPLTLSPGWGGGRGGEERGRGGRERENEDMIHSHSLQAGEEGEGRWHLTQPVVVDFPVKQQQ